MPRNLRIAFGILIGAVLVGLISLRSLHRRMQNLSESQPSEERARRELLAPPISTPSDVKSKAKLFWAAGPDKLAAFDAELPLSADPPQRAKQVLDALIIDPPTPAQRTLPADTTLLAFYILTDGTAVADFSESISSEMPSGILSEQLAVNSILRTLEANVPAAHRLKILIHGQEVDTLAGHVDLTGFFDLHPPAQASSSTGNSLSSANSPAGASPADSKR